MSKILVTGASGTIGYAVLQQLILDSNHEITALDLKSHKSTKRLKRFKNKINILYGDINEDKLINALVRDHDIIIHLAGIIPPFAGIKDNLCRIVDYEGTKNIIKAINKNNPECFLIYASSTTVYGKTSQTKELKVGDKLKVDSDDSYSLVKLRSEEKIQENLKNYTIYRLPAVLGNIKKDAPMYNIPLKNRVEFITAEDAARAFVKAVSSQKKLNHKIFNVTGGVPCRIMYKEFLINVLKIHGLSVRYLGIELLVDKNFYSDFYADSIALEKILEFRQDSINQYFIALKKETNFFFRFFPKLLAKPFIFFIKRRK